jgi:hypothetical protein
MGNPPETPEQSQARIRLAERQHDEHGKQLAATFASIITFASEALKAAALINGGAAAASLALISQVIDKRPSLAGQMISPLRLFAAGLLAAVVATGLSHLAQLCFQNYGAKHELLWHHPWTRPMPSAARWNGRGVGFQVAAIFLVLSAYILALSGFLWSADVLAAAASHKG